MGSTAPENLKKLVSGNLRRLMKTHHIYVHTLIERTRISHNTIVNIRQGRHLPSFDNAVAIARAIGVSLDEFIKEETEEAEP